MLILEIGILLIVSAVLVKNRKTIISFLEKSDKLYLLFQKVRLQFRSIITIGLFVFGCLVSGIVFIVLDLLPFLKGIWIVVVFLTVEWSLIRSLIYLYYEKIIPFFFKEVDRNQVGFIRNARTGEFITLLLRPLNKKDDRAGEDKKQHIDDDTIPRKMIMLQPGIYPVLPFTVKDSGTPLYEELIALQHNWQKITESDGFVWEFAPKKEGNIEGYVPVPETFTDVDGKERSRHKEDVLILLPRSESGEKNKESSDPIGELIKWVGAVRARLAVHLGESEASKNGAADSEKNLIEFLQRGPLEWQRRFRSDCPEEERLILNDTISNYLEELIKQHMVKALVIKKVRTLDEAIEKKQAIANFIKNKLSNDPVARYLEIEVIISNFIPVQRAFTAAELNEMYKQQIEQAKLKAEAVLIEAEALKEKRIKEAVGEEAFITKTEGARNAAQKQRLDNLRATLDSTHGIEGGVEAIKQVEATRALVNGDNKDLTIVTVPGGVTEPYSENLVGGLGWAKGDQIGSRKDKRRPGGEQTR